MLKNEWLLDLDLKFEYSRTVPRYRRGDTAILKMRLHDNSKLYDLSTATDAKVIIGTPSGLRLDSSCLIVDDDTGKLLVFQFEPLHMLEIGTYNILLTVSDGLGKVSPPPFKVRFFDSLSEGDASLIQLIQDLQLQINELDDILVDIVKNSDKGIPDGVASLDSTGKIPVEQLPSPIIEHPKKKVYEKDGVHGFAVDETGLGMYQTPDGRWEYLGYSDTPATALVLETTVLNGTVNLTYTGGSPVFQKWLFGDKSKNDFVADGNIINGLSFQVNEVGIYTIFYRDTANKEYLHKFTVTSENLKQPTIDINIDSGLIIVDVDQPVKLMKWDTGVKDITWFQNNGNTILNNKFIVNTAGDYTVYVKLENGAEYVKVFTVTEEDMINPIIRMPISNLSIGNIFKIGDITFQLLDSVGNERFIISTESIPIKTFSTSGSTAFNPNVSGNIGEYLNNEFYHNILKTDQKDKILTKEWGIGVLTESDVGTNGFNSTPIPSITLQEMQTKENISKVSAKIAIFSMSEFKKYSYAVKTNKFYKAGDEGNYKGIYKLPNSTTYSRTPFTTANQIYMPNHNGTHTPFTTASNLSNYAVMWVQDNFLIELDNAPPTLNIDMVESIAYIKTEDTSRIVSRKWEMGDKPSSYFESQGRDWSSANQTVDDTNGWIYSAENGIATVYVRDVFGNITTQNITFPVQDTTPISLIEQQYIDSLRYYTRKPESGGYNVSDAKSIKYINIRVVNNLTELKYFPNTVEIHAVAVDITDITPIANCKKLKLLWISNGLEITSLDSLAECPQLEQLTIQGIANNVSVSPLSSLKLNHLRLRSSKNLSDLTTLSSQTELNSLYIFCQNLDMTTLNTVLTSVKITYLGVGSPLLTDVSFLIKVPSLAYFNAEECINLNSLVGINKVNLNSLYLNELGISSLNGVESLVNLERITVNNCSKLTSISDLQVLNKLNHIDLKDNAITSFNGVDRPMPKVLVIQLSGNATTKYPDKSNYPSVHYADSFDW